MAEERRQARTVTGRVISNKMDKTITVLIERRIKHPMYGKYLTRSSKIHAHDERNDCHLNDVVTISETRPYSKTKAWKLERIEEKAAGV